MSADGERPPAWGRAGLVPLWAQGQKNGVTVAQGLPNHDLVVEGKASGHNGAIQTHIKHEGTPGLLGTRRQIAQFPRSLLAQQPGNVPGRQVENHQVGREG